MSKIGIAIVSILIIVMIAVPLTPGGRAFLNNWGFTLNKVDEATSYQIIKKVEDTARAMISSYEADRLT